MSNSCRLYRLLAVFCVAVCALGAGAAPAAAQDAWPEFGLGPGGDDPGSHTMLRGPGGYVSIAKIVVFWILFAVWVRTTDWLSRDCLLMRQNYAVWNSVVFFVFFGAVVLLWLLPSFVIGFTLLLLAYFMPLGAYIYFRNAAVEPHQRIFTPDHLRAVLAGKAKKVGVSMSAEKRADYEKGAPVELTAGGADSEQENQANLIKARQSPGFVTAKDLVADVIDHRGDAVMLDYTKEAVGVRYQIDGMWHAGEARDRESGDVMLAVLKTLAALNASERRQKQAGSLGAEYKGAKYKCRLVSQGTQTGERAILKLDDGKVPFKTLEELGIREKMRERVEELMAGDKGFLLFSSMPQGGLTTTMDVAIEETDRLMRDFVSIQEKSNLEKEFENVKVVTYDAAANETPATILPKLIREYPNVIILRNLADADAVQQLCAEAVDDKLVIGSLRAKEAPEALLRVLMLKVPAKDFAPAATAVLNVRLIRKLCSCKVAYEPTPDILKKLGIPAGKIQVLHREPKAEEIEKPCAECNGVGYRGRTAIFELLEVDDKVREVLIRQPKLDLVKKAARAAGMRSLQEEGIVLVAKGLTSLTELMRVLKA